jgi:hypothetical protein
MSRQLTIRAKGRLVTFLLAVFMSAAMAASSFEEAKRKADADEAALHPAQLAALTQAQGAVAGDAFATCMPRPAPQPLPAFVLVLELNGEGRVVNTWSRGNRAIATCMERVFKKTMAFRPPRTPFFTSFNFQPQ